MREKTIAATFGGLLHDVGKVIYRAGDVDNRNHSISGYDMMSSYTNEEDVLNCIRFHHKKEIEVAMIPNDSAAYIVYIADNVAAAADRRGYVEGEAESMHFDKEIPLSPVFNILNSNKERATYETRLFDGNVNYPVHSDLKTPFFRYKEILNKLKEELKFITLNNKAYIDSLLEIIESSFAYVPSSTLTTELADISLYDHSKITAAVASCISEYLDATNITDYKMALMEHEKDFLAKKAFLMFSCDFSGIQKFIFNTTQKGALKSLRSRSFFLELLMEHMCDEIVSNCQVSRANIIYSGGGHSYILLPNTDDTNRFIREYDTCINHWLLDNFGSMLYVATATYECSANDLSNKPASATPYKNIFIELGSQLAEKKLTRYTAEDILRLNEKEAKAGERECKACGTVNDLVGDGTICRWCDAFRRISSEILKKDIVFVTTREKMEYTHEVPLPVINGEYYLYITNEEEARKALSSQSEVVRIYSKNKPCTGLMYSTKIYMGDYAQNTVMDELAMESTGIKRLGVYRGDVDNLGKAFVSGFEREDQSEEEQYRYATLSRTATFSRQMSMFFKYQINGLLDGKNVAIVYSGGDDIFLVGAWDDVIEASQIIQAAFDKYTIHSLTLSAGIGIYPSKYPIYQAAADTARLENKSKEVIGKNSVTLFTLPNGPNENHTYRWKEYNEFVLGEKTTLLQKFFGAEGEDQERGKAFLYRILDLLRNSEEKINIARYAYLLARMEPSSKMEDTKRLYKEFSEKMYEWIFTDKDRRELITAIYIYTYKTRRR